MGDAGMRLPAAHAGRRGHVGVPHARIGGRRFRRAGDHYYNQQLLLQTQPPEPATHVPDLTAAREVVARVRADCRRELTSSEIRTLLALFYVPLRDMPMDVAAAEPESRPMAIRVRRDRWFGPVIRFGAGGPDAVLSLADRGVDLPPLNGFLARQLIERSRLWRRVLAPRIGHMAAEALQQALVLVSELVSELPDIETLDIDPLYAGETHLRAGGLRMMLTEKPGCEIAPGRRLSAHGDPSLSGPAGAGAALRGRHSLGAAAHSPRGRRAAAGVHPRPVRAFAPCALRVHDARD